MVAALTLLRSSRTALQPYCLLLPPQPLHCRRRSSLSFNLEPSSFHAALKLSLLARPFRPNPIAARSLPPITAIFTGIVEEMGQVDRIGPSGDADGGFQMRIAASTVLGGVNLGDSISINGTCLTVSAFDLAACHFTVGLSPETLRRTALADLAPGSPVNLERALQPVSRMGGHFVQGHVDGTGEITSFVPEGDSLWVKETENP
ncbi:riboflavin synthase-like [Curcuma longa]|uniref:riboflavin synthase-like n=1 Tax=Curcuma longa TaxID=136217 RepID=UPI003D9FABF5